MSRSRVAAVAAAAAGLALAGLGAAPADAHAHHHHRVQLATANYVPGSGLYIASQNGTDGLSKVSGSVTFAQRVAGGPIAVSGRVGGLAANTRYVSVPYKDGICAPVAGVTAFPSGSFVTNSRGVARIPAGTVVNPQAINPAGSFNVKDTRSISIRQVILTPVALPPAPGLPGGVPVGTPVALPPVVVPPSTPTVPNVAYVEGCDRTPTLRVVRR